MRSLKKAALFVGGLYLAVVGAGVHCNRKEVNWAIETSCREDYLVEDRDRLKRYVSERRENMDFPEFLNPLNVFSPSRPERIFDWRYGLRK